MGISLQQLENEYFTNLYHLLYSGICNELIYVLISCNMSWALGRAARLSFPYCWHDTT